MQKSLDKYGLLDYNYRANLQKADLIMKKTYSIILSIIMMAVIAFVMIGCGPINTGVKIIDIKLTDEQYAFVIKKGNSDLVNNFNAYLSEIKANGEFDAIVAKYFENKGEKVGVIVNTVNDNDTTTKANGTFVVATNCPFEPFEYIGDDGKVYGIDIEIAKGYADSKGLSLVVKNIGFDAIFAQVDSEYADIGMAGITVNEERQKLYDFSNTYFNASQKLIVASDNTDFDDCKTVEDVENVLKTLSGKTLGYQTGTTGNWYVAGDADWGYDGFANIKAKGYASAQNAIMDLNNGNIYGVVVDEAPAQAMVNSINK